MVKSNTNQGKEMNRPNFLAYYRANTPAAMEWNNARICACCGRTLKHVMMTDAGPMGRECYATETGDHSTRHILDRLEGHGGERTLAIFHRPAGSVAWLRVRTFVPGKSQTVIRFKHGTVSESALIWWADTHAAEIETRTTVPSLEARRSAF